VDHGQLRGRLGAVTTYAALDELVSEFRPLPAAEQFRLLFPVAVDYGSDSASGIASCLLAELVPACPLGCREVVAQVGAACWNPSEKLVPYYLLTQFGGELVDVCRAALADRGRPPGERTAAEGLLYWAEMGAASLVAGHHAGRRWERASSRTRHCTRPGGHIGFS
jgi:hypothetical protein